MHYIKRIRKNVKIDRKTNERRNSGDHKSSVLVHMSLNGWEDKINSKSFFSVANISVRELTDRDSKDSEILFG